MKFESLRFYTLLDRVAPKSFRLKLALVLAVGLTLPLLAVILYLVLFSAASGELRWQILIATGVILALAGIILYFALAALLAPLFFTAASLQKFLGQQVLPSLPMHYEDTAGQMMSDTQFIVTELDRRTTKYDDTALLDHLTHALHRGASEKRLRQEMEYAVSHLQPFALALIDLDHFKEINDHYGLAVGDQCMRHIGKVILQNTRKHDWLGRWGGDEFILVLHNLETAKLEPALLRLNETLHASPIPNLPQDIHLMLSFSVGATILRPGDTPEALLAKAESALYQSKEHGRGSVTVLDERVNIPTKREPRKI